MMKKNKIFCVIGPSGSGKDAITSQINLPKVISYKTRPMREFEINGVDAKFISKTEFSKLADQMIAKTVYAGHEYGILKNDLNELKTNHLIYVIDYAGYLLLKEYAKANQELDPSQLITVFIEAPVTNLRNRMKAQGRSIFEIEKRMDQYWDVDFDARDQCDYIVVNAEGKLLQAIKQFQEIIQMCESGE